VHRSALSGGIVALVVFAQAARAQSGRVEPAEFSKLKDEVRRLQQQLQDLQQEVARLKGGGVSTKASLAARFAAAEALNSTSEQQAALAILAVDAARAGDSKVAKDTLGRLNSTSVAQAQTYKVALLLARAGQTEEAVVLAKSLNSTSQSQKALSKIAKGEVDD
jgi:hypothetical protein